MFITVDPHSGVPVYRQIMDQVKFLVASGELSAGDPMPSTRTLGAELRINPMTVSKAYSLLEKEGILERRRGQPLVVRDQQGEELQAAKIEQLRKALEPAVHLAQSLALDAETILAAVRGALKEAETKES